MRLIRSVCRPANIGVALRFRRCQVLNEISNLVNGSNILGRDRSYAVFAASSAQEDRKPQKRLSKSERRTMVEAYVNQYRITNEGKFPSVSDTMKNIGGGYYTVRQIVQAMIHSSKQSSVDSKYTSLTKSATKKNEMAYNFKKPTDIKDRYLDINAMQNLKMCISEERSVYTEDTSLEKSAMKKDFISNKFEEVPQTRELDKDTRTLLKDTEGSSSTIFRSKQDQQSSVSVDTDEPKDERAQSYHPIDEPQSSRDLDYVKKHEIIEDKIKSGALEQKSEPLESTEVSEREVKEVPLAEPQQTSSMWNNLKSFANGIMSIWKRS